MPHQRSLEELGTPLSHVTFCIVDLETTGGSPRHAAITEVGCVKVRRGEVVGSFQTLVNPGCAVPAFVRLLTGISNDLVDEAPPVEAVLPSFLEFAGDSVLVAHNARFDVGFLNAALERGAYPRLTNAVIDTAALARKVLAGEVPNNKLATVSRHLRCAHQPTHRAYRDALATTDVLHHLIERLSGFGVTTLEDLLAFSFTRADGTFVKIALTDDAPGCPGVYRFVGAAGQTLYVGKATDLRSRVRSYFYGDPRRKIRDLLRETQRIDFETHATLLEAEVAEVRAILSEAPPYNRAHKRSGTWYLKAGLGRNPRVAAVRVPRDDRALYVGPFRAQKEVTAVIDAFRSVTRLHRCTRPDGCSGSASDDLDACAGPDPDAQRPQIRALVASLLADPSPVWERVAARLRMLALHQRFEEAVDLRDRAAAAERAIARSAEINGFIAAGDVALRVGKRIVLFRGGRLPRACPASDDAATDVARLRADPARDPQPAFVPPALFEEVRAILSWLRRTKDPVEVLYVQRAWAIAAGAADRGLFRPRESS